MIRFIFTREQEWLEKWDHYVNKNPKGNHLVLSDWLMSYQSYGFEFQVGLILEGNEIVGGCGVVIPKFLLFKFFIIPHGPLYTEGYEEHFVVHLIQIQNQAKKLGCCYLQLSIPFSSNGKIQKHIYNNKLLDFLKHSNLKKGKLFNHVYSSYGLNWVDLRSFDNAEAFLEQLTPKVRRNIRMPYNKMASSRFVVDIEDLEKGYTIIQENALQAGYSVRSFKEFKNTMFNLISKNKAYFIVCEVDGHLKAAAFFVKTSGYITNIMGGVSREKPDVKLGYMLQWEIIKKSFELGFSGYNISMGGSLGVQEFKSKFGGETIFYEHPHFHVILKPFYFKLFKFFDTYLKSYKNQVSILLARFRG